MKELTKSNAIVQELYLEIGSFKVQLGLYKGHVAEAKNRLKSIRSTAEVNGSTLMRNYPAA